MYILGVNNSHVATAVLMKDGKIIAATSEERFTRVKNHAGFPLQAVKYCLDFAKIKGEDIDLLVFSGNYFSIYPPAFALAHTQVASSAPNIFKIFQIAFFRFRSFLLFLEYKLPYSPGMYGMFVNLVLIFLDWNIERKLRRLIYEKVGIRSEKITRIGHHLAHTYAALYSSPFPSQKKNALIFTCDGEGDGLSATISIFQNSKIKCVVEIPVYNSLGLFYTSITTFLGMKALDDEYKVMGLAPYASKSGKKLAYAILQTLIKVDPKTLRFKTKMNCKLFPFFMRDHLQSIRFDFVAGAIQQITEEILTLWVKETIRKYRIRNVVCGGGVFMNIKANQKIAELPEVEDVFFMPSAGDESNAIGAVYWGYSKLSCGKTPQALRHLYLGPEYSQSDIEKTLRNIEGKYQVKIYPQIEKRVALLLAEGKIVARFSGRMEWGARALGNRSILADASQFEIKDVINQVIKNRDFWMPFAPTILKEREKDYLINPKKIEAPYMILAFNSTLKAQEELKAALHPYDKTLRPQIIDQQTNPSYHQILREFENLTGRGGIINTSFNLQGEPIVCSPKDALCTFENSGLQYLAMNNYLITKRV